MKTVLQLRQERGALVNSMRVLIAKSEGRAMTTEEQRDWDVLDAQQGRLAQSIATLDPDHAPRRGYIGDRDGLAQVEQELAEPLPLVAGRRQDDAPGAPVESRILGPKESVRDYIARRQRRVDPDLAGLRFGNLMRAMVTGPKSPAERRALAEGSDSTGGVTVPDITSAQLIDRMRSRLVLTRLGAQVVPLESDKNTIAKLKTDPVAAWRTENSPVAESDPTFEGVVFQPKTLAVIVRASRELVEDSLNITTALEQAFAGSFAVELERVALAGSGTAPEPRGLRNITGVHELAATAAPTNWDQVIDLMALVWGSNAVVNGIVYAPRTAAAYAKLKSTTNDPLGLPPVLNGIPQEMTTAVSITEGTAQSSLYLGDWTQMLLGIRTSLQVILLRERYADLMQFAWLCYLRADIAVAHAEAFGRLISIPATALAAAAEEHGKGKR
jgi:HK97 family phage major capsid protein